MSEYAGNDIALTPIGKIWTGFKSPADCPFNAHLNEGTSQIELDPAYLDGLFGLQDRATHLVVLYWFDQADRNRLQTSPPHVKGDDVFGVFALRAPHRPNPIALSTVEIKAIDGNVITVSGLDCCDGTFLLDLKPYVPAVDRQDTAIFNVTNNALWEETSPVR